MPIRNPAHKQPLREQFDRPAMKLSDYVEKVMKEEFPGTRVEVPRPRASYVTASPDRETRAALAEYAKERLEYLLATDYRKAEARQAVRNAIDRLAAAPEAPAQPKLTFDEAVKPLIQDYFGHSYEPNLFDDEELWRKIWKAAQENM